MFSVPGIMSSVGNPEMNRAHALSSSLSMFPLISLIKGSSSLCCTAEVLWGPGHQQDHVSWSWSVRSNLRTHPTTQWHADGPVLRKGWKKRSLEASRSAQRPITEPLSGEEALIRAPIVGMPSRGSYNPCDLASEIVLVSFIINKIMTALIYPDTIKIKQDQIR